MPMEPPPRGPEGNDDQEPKKLPLFGQIAPTQLDVKPRGVQRTSEKTKVEGVPENLGDETLDGRYQLTKRIGDGGMGTVYEAKHVLMDKTVAVKVIHDALAYSDHIAKRFEREAKSASRLTDPHCINVTDFGRTSGGALFLVMELLQGETLSERLRKNSPLSVEKASQITRHILKALIHAHEVGVVHRDLKPDNVMLVTHGDETDFAKVFDFGIAKLASGDEGDENLTSAGLILGTPSYMSPEQSTGKMIDHRADIYAVGVMLYEMLAGVRPFRGNSPVDVVYSHVSGPIPALPKNCDAPHAFQKIINKALAKKPENRFATAQEFLEALDKIDLTEDKRVVSVSELLRLLYPIRHLFAYVVSRRLYRLPTSIRQRLEQLETSSLSTITHATKGRLGKMTKKKRRIVLAGVIAAILGASAFASLHWTKDKMIVEVRSAVEVATERQIEEEKLSRLLELASTQIRNGLVKKASGTARQALRLSPDNPVAHLLLGHSLFLRGDRLGATKSYARALSRDESLAEDKLLEEHLQQALKFPKPRENAASILARLGGKKGIEILASRANSALFPGDERAVARQALSEAKHEDAIDWVASLRADFEQYTSCSKRRELVAQMVKIGDQKFLPILKAELRRPTTSDKKEKKRCGIQNDIRRAYHTLNTVNSD